MDKNIDYGLLRAFEDLKKDKGFSTDYKLCKYLDIPQAMFSNWLRKPQSVMREKVWNRIKEKVEPYLSDEVAPVQPNPKIIKVLNKYASIEDTKFILAALANEVVDLEERCELVPDEYFNLNKESLEGLNTIIKTYCKFSK